MPIPHRSLCWLLCKALLPTVNSTRTNVVPVADGEHVQLFKTMWDCKRKFYTVPV